MANKAWKNMLCWNVIPCTKSDINLDTLLSCGQSFTWKKTGNNVWTNVINGRIYSVTQTETQFYWCAETTGYELPDLPERTADPAINVVPSQNEETVIKHETKVVKNETLITIPPTAEVDDPKRMSQPKSSGDMEKIIWDYFALDVDLMSLYIQWSKCDNHFSKVSRSFSGVRILQQDPTENLFAFICSSNNHVSRIASMVNKLTEHFGHFLGSVGGHDFYSFPTPERLAGADVETKLRHLGFGYRAKFIAKTASILHLERPEGWLESLRGVPYRQCVEELMKLSGVGRKVADCVALMSLNKPHVVPVDTHVLQIAVRDYTIPGIGKEVKTMTPALHDKISEFFVSLYGGYAGWAHTVLFAADLKRFSDGSEPVKSEPKSHRPKPTSSDSVKPNKKPKIAKSKNASAQPNNQRRSKRLQT